mmetsp:Transcript_11469/g.20266  ORF Transcript_11469/g.20266 Transcript_11469/m.20266 type:complete len:314 (+) Transcript_11469:993-1934(+)
MAAFKAASPPLRSSTSQRGMPSFKGSSVYLLSPGFPASTSTISAGAMGVSSSSPAECTTSALRKPSRSNEPAMSSLMSVEYTPTSPYSASAGLSKGPSMLRAVRTLSAARTGRKAFMAGWYLGAYMKPTPDSRKQAATPSGPRSTAMSSASNTSALPHRLDTDRFPCFATRAPAAAAMTLAPVLMFTEPMPSPPVPTMSRTGCPMRTRMDLSSIARARPAISPGVSPLARKRTRNAAACSDEKSSRRSVRVCSACCSVKSCLEISISITSRICILAARQTACLRADGAVGGCCTPAAEGWIRGLQARKVPDKP